MATYTFAPIDPALSPELVDLIGVQYDLDSVQEYCHHALEATSSDGLAQFLGDVFTIAIVVRYARAFSSGVRKWDWPGALTSLAPAERDFHEWIINLRSKHIAHSVNEFEESEIRAQYVVERVDSEGFFAIGFAHHRLDAIGADNIRSVAALASRVSSIVARRVEELKIDLLERVRAKPVAEILGRPQRAVQAVDAHRVTTARPRGKA